MDRSRNTSGGVSTRTFEDYDPAVEWNHAADADTATISLPGFKKEEVRVQVDSKGHLLVRGERPVEAEAGSSKWVRFSKDLMKLPDNCDTDGIRVAKLENSKLTITVPKKNRPWASGSWYALAPPPLAAQQEEGKGRHPSPSGGSALEPAPAVQEDKKSHPSPPDDSASEPVPAVQEEQEKSRRSPPDGSTPELEPPLPLTQEDKNSLPSPPDSYASEPTLAVQEEADGDEEETTMVEAVGADQG